MSEYSAAQQEIRALLAQIAENEAGPAELARLREIVTHDREARRWYIRYSHFYASLQWYAASGSARHSPPSLAGASAEPVASSPVRPRAARPGAASPRVPPQTVWGAWGRRAVALLNQPLTFSLIFAASALLAGVTVLGLLRIGGQDAGQTQPARTSAATRPIVARIMAMHGCVWREGGERFDRGSRLRSGQQLQLTAGVAQLRFNTGSEVVLEGPVQVRLAGPNQLYLRHGRLAAQVPRKAVGFEVATPAGVAIDLGTEFAVEVDTHGQTEIHVFSGEVRFAPRSAGSAPPVPVQLTSEQAIRYSPGKNRMRRLSADDAAFTRAVPKPEVPLIGFYPCNGDFSDASGWGHHPFESRNVAFVPGYEGQACRFQGTEESYLDLPIDASAAALPRLTWGAWVCPAVVDRQPREIFSTDNGGYDRVLGLDTRGGPQYGWVAFTGRGVLQSPAPTPQAGQWYFVAGVYDQEAHTAQLYVKDLSLAAADHRLLQVSCDTTWITESQRFLRVGRHAGHFQMPFQGELDNVFVVAEALSREQLDAISEGGEATIRKMAGLAAPQPSDAQTNPVVREP